MRSVTIAVLFALFGTTVVGAQGNTTPAAAKSTQRAGNADSQAWVAQNLQGWPKKTQELAAKLITKYGKPQEKTSRQLFWYGNGPWKRTVLYKEENLTEFPAPHADVLEQVINYRTPVEKFSDLARYNGSVMVSRTNGELVTRSDSEAANFLAVNLVNDIVTGSRSVEQALGYHGQATRALMTGSSDSYLEKIAFNVAASNASTADRNQMAPLIAHQMGKDPVVEEEARRIPTQQEADANALAARDPANAPKSAGASAVIGMRIFDSARGTEELGRVEDASTDNSGAVTYIIVASGGKMSVAPKLTAIPWGAVRSRVQGDRMILDRAQLAGAPAVSHAGGLSDAKQRAAADSYWSRAPGAAAPSETTSEPTSNPNDSANVQRESR